MTSTTKMLQALSELTDMPVNRANKIGTALRNFGVIESGRGFASRDITVEDTVNLIIGFLVLESFEDALDILQLFKNMPIVSGNLDRAGLNTNPPFNNFGEVLTATLTDSYFNVNLDSLRVSKTVPQAFMTWIDDDEKIEIEFKSTNLDREVLLRKEVVLDGRVIRYLQNFVNPKGTAHNVPDIAEINFALRAKIKKYNLE